MFGIDTAKLIIYGVAAAVISGVIWWYGFHNPNVIEDLKADNKQLTEQVAAGQEALKLLEDIKHGQQAIDKKTYQNISTIRARIMPRNTVVVRGGLR